MIQVTNIKVEMGYKTGMRFNHTQASLKPHASPTSKPSNTFYDKENTMRTRTIFVAAALLAVSLAVNFGYSG